MSTNITSLQPSTALSRTKACGIARSCSSGPEVSRVRWQNTYHFVDFHGSVDTLLKYYDAHFYIANWGTVRLGLTFPEGVVTPYALQQYLLEANRYEDTLTIKEIGNRLIVWRERNEEGGWWDTGGEGPRRTARACDCGSGRSFRDCCLERETTWLTNELSPLWKQAQ